MDWILLVRLSPLIVKYFPATAYFFWHKYKPSDFELDDRLFHAFKSADLDENNQIEVNVIRFPDFSCNWDKFSNAESVRHRTNGSATDGCFSIKVRHARFNNMATACHDPLKDENNYSHVEIRQLSKEENVFFEAPKNRKLEKESQGWSKRQRLEYRQHLVFNLVRELEPVC